MAGKAGAVQIGNKKQMGKGSSPEQSRASACMELAERFNLPVISFVDTPAAYPGVGSEERGVAEAIARSCQASADAARWLAAMRDDIAAQALATQDNFSAVALRLHRRR